jgi:hypothetical protein
LIRYSKRQAGDTVKRVVAAAIALLLTASQLPAQEDEPGIEHSPRTATVTAGIGNSMGWFGTQGELYFGHTRLSAFGGLGYTPSLDPGDPTGITGAAGFRAYTNGIKHRGFLELSLSQVVVQTGPAGGSRHYGPGLQAGYQYTALGGFTLLVSGGVGVALGLDGNANVGEVQPLLGLGVGYTWR